MAKRTIEIPEELGELGATLEKLVAEAKMRIAAAQTGEPVDFAEVERSVEKLAAEAEREVLRGLLQALDIDERLISIGGKPFARVGRHPATYKTKAGPVTVARSLYRELGKRNAKTVDPVSLRAGVVEDGWLPDTAKAMAFLIQNGTSREAEAIAKETGRLPYSRCSFERIGHAVGHSYGERRQEIDAILIGSFAIPADGRSVSLSVDRGAMPMEEPRVRPAGRPKKNAAKRPIERNWRMAYCATVTIHDKDGTALHTIRYGRTPKRQSKELCSRLGADLRALIEQRPDLSIVLLSDGAAEMSDILDQAMKDSGIALEAHRLVDFWHVAEKLGKAAVVIHGNDHAGAVISRWKALLLNTPNARGRILNELHASGMEHVAVGETEPVHEAIRYLYNQGDRMAYATARKLGLPVGSGNVEATCKSLIGLRMKRPGARWKEDTGQHVLDLRALALSDRWAPAISLTLAPLRAEVRRVA